VGSRRQSKTGIPAMSGLLITAVSPGGQGDGVAGALSTAATATGGGAGIATAGVGAVSATASTGVGGGGAVVAGAGVGRGASAGAGVPVMLGANAIGPGGGSTLVGGLMSAVAGGAGCSIGEHAPSPSGIAIIIATAATAPIRRPPRPGFPLRTIVPSSISGMASPGVIPPGRILSARLIWNNARTS
jgi:hypothetical protein